MEYRKKKSTHHNDKRYFTQKTRELIRFNIQWKLFFCTNVGRYRAAEVNHIESQVPLVPMVNYKWYPWVEYRTQPLSLGFRHSVKENAIMANLYYLFTTGPKNNKNNYVYNNLSNIWWTPDGEDTVDKVKTMAFAGTTLGVGFGGLGIVLARPRFFYQGIGVFARVFVPTTAACVLYAWVTNMLGEKRHKSDIYNHGIGAFVAGAISAGAVSRRYKIAIITGAIFSMAAVGMKTIVKENLKETDSTLYYDVPKL